jgi:hypothetical protein
LVRKAVESKELQGIELARALWLDAHLGIGETKRKEKRAQLTKAALLFIDENGPHSLEVAQMLEEIGKFSNDDEGCLWHYVAQSIYPFGDLTKSEVLNRMRDDMLCHAVIVIKAHFGSRSTEHRDARIVEAARSAAGKWSRTGKRAASGTRTRTPR